MLSFIYLIQEYKKRVYLTLRQFLLFALVISAIFFFAALWPATNFYYTATFQHGLYDLWVNGPLKDVHIKKIVALFKLKEKDYIKISSGFFASKLFIGNKVINNPPTMIMWAYPPSDYKKLNLTSFSPGLLLKGTFYFGKYLLETFGMYVPNETTYFLAAFVFAINLLVLLATMVQLAYRFSRLDVTKLLTSE